jgi:hypothetical protein
MVLIDASIIGASAVTLATSYAFGDVFGLRHSLNRGFKDAPAFYGSYSLMVMVAAGIVLIPNAPLGVITTAVQALAGVLLPSATVFLLLLCNDYEVLGPWVNKPWLNAVASVIIGILLVLSMALVVSTIFPAINVGVLFVILMGVLAAALVAGGIVFLLNRGGRVPDKPMSAEERAHWRMPPLAFLERPKWSVGRTVGMWSLRLYLLVAMLLLVVKAAQLASGHH